MDTMCATACTSGGAAGGLNVCFPAVSAVETPKESPWDALTSEECAQHWDMAVGILWAAQVVSMLFYSSALVQVLESG